MINRPWHVAVLIPACNEEKLLPRCLASVMEACAALSRSCSSDIIVIVDSSTDLTGAIANAMLSRTGVAVSTEARAVGPARALAAKVALARYTGPMDHCWLANTDADCAVPRTWLLDQLILAETGVEAIAGTIDVDCFEDHQEVVPERFYSSYSIFADGTHPHVHGANLGVRADVYAAVGGWSHLETAEDHDLWHKLLRQGSKRASVGKMRVTTSGRRTGRAPHGFAEALAAHNEAAHNEAAHNEVSI